MVFDFVAMRTSRGVGGVFRDDIISYNLCTAGN